MSTKTMAVRRWRLWCIRSSTTRIGGELGLDLPEAGAFGENLTVTGLVESDVHIGDIFEVGTSVVQVTQPRARATRSGALRGPEPSVAAQKPG